MRHAKHTAGIQASTSSTRPKATHPFCRTESEPALQAPLHRRPPRRRATHGTKAAAGEHAGPMDGGWHCTGQWVAAGTRRPGPTRAPRAPGPMGGGGSVAAWASRGPRHAYAWGQLPLPLHAHVLAADRHSSDFVSPGSRVGPTTAVSGSPKGRPGSRNACAGRRPAAHAGRTKPPGPRPPRATHRFRKFSPHNLRRRSISTSAGTTPRSFGRLVGRVSRLHDGSCRVFGCEVPLLRDENNNLWGDGICQASSNNSFTTVRATRPSPSQRFSVSSRSRRTTTASGATELVWRRRAIASQRFVDHAEPPGVHGRAHGEERVRARLERVR